VGITFSAILLIIVLSVLINRVILHKLWQPFYGTVEALPLLTLSKKQPPSFPETEVDEFIFLKDHLNAAITRLQQEHRSLLLLAKIEHHQFTAVAPVNVKERIEEKVQQLQALWHHNNLRVTTRLQPVTVNINPELMDILLNHLLNNATRHNIPGGDLCITLTPDCLTIENTGEQKPPDEGAGLSIIREICAQAGITLKYSFASQRHFFLLMFP
jgi:signal transduction histidine kinase